MSSQHTIGVQFRTAGKVYTFLTDDASLRPGEPVLVESDGGAALGVAATTPRETPDGEVPQNAKKVLHRATAEELATDAATRERAVECFRLCQQMIRERNMPMKLAEVEMAEGGKKALFLFSSEQRVDFRTLVRDLAAALHLRIEMRQVGSRDEAKVAGCMGPCGLTTCCSTHLRQFQSISISMAKHQGLAPNPAKLTGMCNKLKCCLAYEAAAYDECRQGLPKVGAAVDSPEGPGKVSGHNVLKRECIVRLYGGGEARMGCEKCRVLSPEEREAALTAARQAQQDVDERRARRRQERGRKDQRHDRPKR